MRFILFYFIFAPEPRVYVIGIFLLIESTKHITLIMKLDASDFYGVVSVIKPRLAVTV
ncbi:hypothetical protein BACCIP111899_04163 [Bacillus rhizoplanae]|uniref:Uncharacterized protein n=1 Tax=Bacillus rhizoplanae TaxID=2880966 RepID=A0ABM8YGH5_9BACI|nr:hypothetical protein BACCIP111899_04163 [Bacillus rhizoplanae]